MIIKKRGSGVLCKCKFSTSYSHFRDNNSFPTFMEIDKRSIAGSLLFEKAGFPQLNTIRRLSSMGRYFFAESVGIKLFLFRLLFSHV